MDNCVSKLVESLNLTILDLENDREELSTKSKKYEEISEMLEEVNDDVRKVCKYKNQDLILNYLDGLGTTEREYKASCYLLDSEEEDIRSLPQYIESSDYMERLLNYFKKIKDELAWELSELRVVCDDKEINKKYFDLFSTESSVVSDAMEFRELLDRQVLADEEKISLLLYTIKKNMNNYSAKEEVKGR